MFTITDRELKVYIRLVEKGAIRLGVSGVSERLTERTELAELADPSSAQRAKNIKTLVREINNNGFKQAIISQNVRWDYVLGRGSKKHILELWRIIGRPPNNILPFIGKNRDPEIVRCIMKSLPEDERLSTGGEADLYGYMHYNLNAVEVALSVENYKTAAILLKLDVQPRDEFWRYILDTPRTTPQFTRRVRLVSKYVQPDSEDLLTAINAFNPEFVRILINEDALHDVTENNNKRKILTTVNRKYKLTVKSQTKSLLKIAENDKTMLERQLNELRKINKPGTQEKQTKIHSTIQRYEEMIDSYKQCVRDPENCQDDRIKSTPSVVIAADILNMIHEALPSV